MTFFKVIITPQIMGVFQKIFCCLNFSMTSTSVPKFIEIQNTWCNPFAHLTWNDLVMSIMTSACEWIGNVTKLQSLETAAVNEKRN